MGHAEEKYRRIIESLREGYYEVALDGTFTFVNDAVCGFLGRSRADVLGTRYRDHLPADIAGGVDAVLESVRVSERRRDLVRIPLRRIDGSTVQTEHSIDVVRDDSGAVAGFRGVARDITGRLRAELELRASEEKFRQLVENIEDVIYIVNPAGRIRYISPSGLRRIGHSEEDLAARPFFEFIQEEHRAAAVAFYRDQLLRNVSKTFYELPIIKKDGSVIWVEQSVKLVPTEGGGTEFYCIARDITEKKKAVEALRRSEERYRNILGSINDGYYEVDLAGAITFCNEAMARTLGYPPEELVSMGYGHFMDESEINIVYSIFNEVYQTGVPSEVFAYKFRRKDGSVCIAETTASLVFDEAGRKAGFRGILRDITERKNAEDELRRSEEKYRLIIEHASDIICMCDRSGRFLFMNPAGLARFGYTAEGLMGIRYRELIPTAHRERVLTFYRDQLRKQIRQTYLEFEAATRDGELFWVGQTVSMVADADGALEFHIVARDITAKKQAEAALIELDRQKSNFFANVSHEIRTPLTLILSPVESALQGDFGDRADRDFLLGIQRNAIRLLKLINNILDFSKIEAGRMTMRLRETDIVAFLRRYLGSIESAAEARNIALDLAAAPDALTLLADTEKMDKVFMNLFSNALKFTAGGGRITVRVRVDAGACVIEMEDDGEGIPADKTRIIFDRFGQADTGTTRRYEGTGIGLALAKEFVEMHDGTISVVSRHVDAHPDDHGSVFIITLPMDRERWAGRPGVEIVTGSEVEDAVADHRFAGMREMTDLAAPAPPVTASTHSPVPSDRPRVLVVDDNADMREFIAALLARDYEVHLAVHGADGLARADELRPDLIVTDVMMPVMNGYELTRRLKARDDLRAIPVIMLTARAELANKIEGLEFGADDYLTKPFNSKELLTRVAALLKSSRFQRMLAERNRIIENDLAVARLIIDRILPRGVPGTAGFRFHATYLPADTVGGDFYDIAARDGRIELFIADVSGHGLSSAFLAMIAKITLDAMPDRSSPGRVLADLNEAICRATVQANFITAFYGVVDRADGVMRYCSAGHAPALLFRRGRDGCAELNAQGKPMGWFAGEAYEERRERLEPGDRVVLYTDGITEAWRADTVCDCRDPECDMFGQERLAACLRDCADRGPEGFSRELMARLRAFTATERFSDDITMIVFDVTAP